jgi:hypothetical protein
MAIHRGRRPTVWCYFAPRTSTRRFFPFPNTELNLLRLLSSSRHPAEMGAPEVETFLAHLAVGRNVVASTQNQAFSALFSRRPVPLGGPGIAGGRPCVYCTPGFSPGR